MHGGDKLTNEAPVNPFMPKRITELLNGFPIWKLLVKKDSLIVKMH